MATEINAVLSASRHHVVLHIDGEGYILSAAEVSSLHARLGELKEQLRKADRADRAAYLKARGSKLTIPE